MATLGLCDDMCLLMLDDATGSACRLRGHGREFAVAAAVLSELSQHGRIEIEPDQIVVRDASPTGEPTADAVLAEISSGGSCAPVHWVRHVGLESGSEIAHARLARLVESGILERLPGGLFFRPAEVAQSRRYPAMEGRRGHEVRDRVMQALFGHEKPDLRDAELIGLADACGVFDMLFRAADLDKLRDEIARVGSPSVLRDALKQATDAESAGRSHVAVGSAHGEFKSIPAVPGLPLLGNALSLTGDLQSYLNKLHQRYGPICSIRAPGRRIVVIAGKQANAFVAEHSQTHLRSNRAFADFCGAQQTDRSIISTDGGDHIRLRRIAHDSLARSSIKDNVPTAVAIARDAVAGWPDGKPLSVYSAMQDVAIPQISTIATGLSATEYVDDLRYWFDSLIIAVRRDRPKFMRERRLRKVRPRIAELFREAAKMHDPQLRTGCPRDVIDEVLETHRRDPQFLPETDLQSAVTAPFIQSLDPIAGTLGFALLRLLEEPQYMEMLRQEADDAFAAGFAAFGGEGSGLDTTYAFLDEVMRCHTISPLLLRTACNSFEFEGHWVPAGTSLWVATAVVHQDPDYYPEPEKFDPQRHLPPRLESRQAGAYVPFGIGPHSCVGDAFSCDQMAVTLATLLHCAEFDRYPTKDRRVRFTSSPTLRPHPKCRVQITRHRSAALEI